MEAEQLLRQDGDFLVRESHQTPGQFVLTGMQVGNILLFLKYSHVFMQGQSRKHLLLVDPHGVVRSVRLLVTRGPLHAELTTALFYLKDVAEAFLHFRYFFIA